MMDGNESAGIGDGRKETSERTHVPRSNLQRAEWVVVFFWRLIIADSSFGVPGVRFNATLGAGEMSQTESPHSLQRDGI